jgi:SSS family solute:Na+ symporter
MSIQLFIVIAYVCVLFGISFYVKSKADKGSADYLFASRELTTVLIGTNVAGLAIGAASTVGVAENAYKIGMAAGWYNAAWAAGALVMGIFAAGKFRALHATTIPELFERFYDTKGRVISAVGLIIIMLVITALQYLAGGAILSALLPTIFSFKGGMVASAVVFIGITLIGGLWSSGISNVLNVVLIYLGVLYSAIESVDKVGGISGLLAKLPVNSDLLNPLSGLPFAVILGWFVVMITQTITAQGPVQIACAAKNAKNAKHGFIFGAALILPIGFICALIGIIAFVLYPDIKPTMALPTVIMGLNPFASGITLAAMWAADVSTACTILLGAGTLFAQDIYKRFFAKNMSDQKYVHANRITVLICGLLTLWLAFNAVGILRTMLIGLSLTTALTVVFLFTVFAPQLCRKSSAFYTTLMGLLAIILWYFVPVVRIFPHVIYFEWMVCLITFFVITIVDKRGIESPDFSQEEEA